MITIAIFSAVRNKKQTKGSMMGVMKYICDNRKTVYRGRALITGVNCNFHTSWIEMNMTKQRFNKNDGRQFYQFVQSFPEEDYILPSDAHVLGLILAEKLFPGYEVLVATHCNTNNPHNHILVNSVNFENGKKLHQNHDTLVQQRQTNDELCMEYGFSTLKPYEKQRRGHAKNQKEHRAAERNQSWKQDLIFAIEYALKHSATRKEFIENMENEGYNVEWKSNRKYITYTTPDGNKCRDRRLHDDKFLKENMEELFEMRERYGYEPEEPELEENCFGGMGEMSMF